MLGFIKKKWKIIILLLLPIFLIIILKYFSKEITVDGWLGFLGGYFGVLGAVGTVYLQYYEEKKKKIKNAVSYIKFILDFNYKRNFENNVQFELIKTFTLEGEIISISNKYNYFLEFNEEEIQNNISLYNELNIIEKIYELISLIKCFTNHYNYYFKRYNKFCNYIIHLEENLNFEKESLKKIFRIIYNLTLTLSKINEIYNSIENSPNLRNNLSWLKIKNKKIIQFNEKLKEIRLIYKFNYLDDTILFLEELNEEKIKNKKLNLEGSSILFKCYKESLKNLFYFLEDHNLLTDENFNKYKLWEMYYCIEYIYDSFCSLKEKIEDLKKSL